ncbi:MAG: pyridoxamine 5'-phosphate oxidase family protein [Bacteroidota bacterium]
MEGPTQMKLAGILREGRVAALGTIHEGAPMVSMVAYAVSEELTTFYLLTSELAQHTQDMRKDRNVSLMINEVDDGRDDPLTLARVSLRGHAAVLPAGEPGYMPAKNLYVGRYPQAAPLFDFGDFELWRITVRGGRFVAGFARAFNLTPDALGMAAGLLKAENQSQPGASS